MALYDISVNDRAFCSSVSARLGKLSGQYSVMEPEHSNIAPPATTAVRLHHIRSATNTATTAKSAAGKAIAAITACGCCCGDSVPETALVKRARATRMLTTNHTALKMRRHNPCRGAAGALLSSRRLRRGNKIRDHKRQSLF